MTDDRTNRMTDDRMTDDRMTDEMADREGSAAAFQGTLTDADQETPTDADAPPVTSGEPSDFPLSPDLYQSPDYRRLAALIDRAWDLAREGGLSPAATDAQKWQAGDLVGAMGRAAAGARDRLLDPVLPVTPEARAAYRACTAAYDAFLGAQGLARGTLVDAGLTAATFPPGDPIRSGPLSFSHARALTRLRSGGARSTWAARAVREGLSVARLQTLLNIEGPHIEGPGGAASEHSADLGHPAASGHPISGRPGGRSRPRHGHVCALTGVPIVNLPELVELRLDPDAAVGFDLSALAGRLSARGGAARPGPDGSPPRFPVLLRFSSLAALARWLTVHRGGQDGGASQGGASA